jgi:hypothetical protein
MNLRTRALALALLAGVVAVSSALAGGDPKRFTVSSTLDGKKVLPLRIHPTAGRSPEEGQPSAAQSLYRERKGATDVSFV